ncbi:MAG: AMP-binding protein [Promethearchaeota archaeon]
MVKITKKPNLPEPWMQFYPEGIPRELDYDEIPIDELLHRQAKALPNANAMKFMGKAWTYAELEKMVDKFAAGLIKLGLKEKETVLIDLPNSPQHYIAYMATLRAGGQASPVIPLHKGAEIIHQANDSKAKIAIFMDKIWQGYMHGKNVEEKIPSLKTVILTGLGDYMPGFTRFMGKALGKIPYWKKWDKKDGSLPILKFEDIYEKDTSALKNVKVNPREDAAFLLYTGGTTGKSKGVILTHFNIITNVTQMAYWINHQIEDLPSPTDGSFDIYLPIGHVFGLNLALIAALFMGYTNNLYARPPDKGEEYFKNAIKEKTTILPAVPSMWNKMAMDPNASKYKGKLTFLKAGASGAAALPYEVKTTFEERTGAVIIEGWGMTEGGLVTVNPYHRSRVWTVGVPAPDIWVKITDAETGINVLPQCPHKDPYCQEKCGKEEAQYIGEIAFTGPNMMKGYLNNPEETNRVIRKDPDGIPFYYSSDIGCINCEGYLKIKDRKRDMIKRKGHAVFPMEIEDLMMMYEPIFEVGVFGVPDAESGEEVNAAVALKPEFIGKVSEQDIINWCKENMAPYKYPRKVYILKELPKSMIGKILRRTLRDEYGK